MRPLLDTTAAYIAGLLDGEGSISAWFSSARERRDWASQINAQVTITNTDFALLHDLVEITGIGRVASKPIAVANRAKHKPSGFWHVSICPAADLLTVVRPWLKVKRRQAALFIELAEIRAAHPRLGRGRRRLNPERQCAIVAELARLNRRGPHGRASAASALVMAESQLWAG